MSENPTINPNTIPAEDTKDSEKPGPTYNEGQGEPDVIMMTGPLGEVYTKALQVYFAKKPVDVTAVTESQAMDESIIGGVLSTHVGDELSNIASGIKLQTTEDVVLGNVSASVFAVDKARMNRPDIVNQMEKLHKDSIANNKLCLFIVELGPLDQADNIHNNSNKSVVLDPLEYSKKNYLNVGSHFSSATECLCEKMGMDVVYGMEGFAVWVIDNYKKKIAKEGIIDIDSAKEFISGLFKGKKNVVDGVKTDLYDTLANRLKKAKESLTSMSEEQDLVASITANFKHIRTNSDYVELAQWYEHVLANARTNVLNILDMTAKHVSLGKSYMDTGKTEDALKKTQTYEKEVVQTIKKMLGATTATTTKYDHEYILPNGLKATTMISLNSFEKYQEYDDDDCPVYWPIGYVYSYPINEQKAVLQTITLVDDDVDKVRKSLLAAIDGTIKLLEQVDEEKDGQVVYTACDIYAKHEDYEMIVGEVIERTWKGHYFRGFLTFATEVCMLVEDIK